MGSELKPYPDYKDSGVEALGKVPAHWDVRRLASFGTFSKGSGGSKEEESSSGVPCIRYGDLYTTHQYFITKSRSFVSPRLSANYTPIRFGDLLFAASGETVEEIGKSAVNLMAADACCGGDVILFRPRRNMEARYLGYTADCRPATVHKSTMGRGFTVVHIYTNQLKNLRLALPPLFEQAAIARFLDHTDRRIQRYIRAKEKLVALLQEYQQVLVSDAVTGRIDVRTGKPYPAYKDSGVEWLGDVPAHWDVRRLKQICRLGYGDTLATEVRRSGNIPVFGSNGRIGSHRSANTEAPCIVVGRKGSFGKVHFSSTRVFAIDTTFVIDKRLSRAHIRWLFYLLGYLRLDEVNNDSAIPGLAREAAYRRLAPVPLHPEQVAIARFLDTMTEKLQKTIAQSQREIELLREYRTRLIADVVTGKLNVRAAAMRLPEISSADSDESLDHGSVASNGFPPERQNDGLGYDDSE